MDKCSSHDVMIARRPKTHTLRDEGLDHHTAKKPRPTEVQAEGMENLE